MLRHCVGEGMVRRSARRWLSWRIFAWLLTIACSVDGGPVFAEPPTAAAKADGKAFGAAINPKAISAAKTAPTSGSVPNFTADPSQKSYYSAPGSLAPAAAAMASGNVGYQQVQTSIAVRPKIPPAQVTDTIARGKAVAETPLAYTSGFTASGTPGSCHPLPPASGSPGTYEQSCNTGFIAGSTNQTCPVVVKHTITTVTDYRYSCSDGNGFDSCSIFPDPPLCTVTGSKPGKCLQGYYQNGRFICTEPGETIYLLSCAAPVPGATLQGTSTRKVDNRTIDDSACNTIKANAQCNVSSETCVDASPPTRTISDVPITEACWGWTRTYACNGLTPAEDCSSLPKGCVFERTECISPTQSPCLTTDDVYLCPLPARPSETQSICDGDVYCLNGSCDTIDRTPNTDFGKAVVALNAIDQAGKEFDPKTLQLFKGARMTCSKTIFGVTNCCVPRGFPLIGSCNAEDKALKKQREKGLCHLVGSYCSSSFLGICLSKKEAHCCFISKISRILQEQGRPQIGFPWAKPKDEKCPGFTIDQFQHLDLSKMDFSEVYAEFTNAAKLPDELATANDLKTKITTYFKSKTS